MIWQIVKKQGLTLLRNPMQLLLLIGLPIILIAILGASLGSFMNGESVTIDAKVALIEQEGEQEQIERFIQDAEVSDLPIEAKTEIKAQAKHFKLIERLKEDVFTELTNIIQLEMVDFSKKDDVLRNDSYAAVIEVPENFTYDILQKTFLDKGTPGALAVYKNEGHQLGSTIVEDILRQYQEQLSLITFAEKNGVRAEDLQLDQALNIGKITAVDHNEPVSAKEYYAIGMAVMNVLFIASTIGSYAFNEKKTHVFNRVILADVSRWVYFIGIFIAGTLFAVAQLLIIFGASWLLFGVTWPNALGFFAVTLGLGIAVGGVSVLLTAISYQLDSEIITNFFQSILISILAFIGGSFFPVGDFSKVIQVMGNFTPNGAGMTAYLSILRGNDVASVLNHIAFLIIFAGALIVVAALSFPKRGKTT